MAAPIKMDELLVSWLGSDEVYENVLSLIEKYRVQRQQQNQPSSPESPKTSKASNASEKGGTIEEPQDPPSPRGVVIPPFYPLQTATGTMIQRRRQLPRQSETWERLPSTNTSGGSGSSGTDTEAASPPTSAATPNPLATAKINKKKNSKNNIITTGTSTNNGATEDTPDDEQQEDKQLQPDQVVALCVKDQVLNLLPELEIPLPPAHELNSVAFTLDAFVRITKEVCLFPTFFNGPLYQRILDMWFDESKDKDKDANGDTNVDEDVDPNNSAQNQNQNQTITFQMLEWFWKTEMEPYDPPERFFRLIKQPDQDCILRDDFLPYVKALLNDHPGLEFLSNHAEFQEKYAVSVITRIFYSVNKCHSGRITSRQVRRSDLLEAFSSVDEEEDINKVTRYFSYEHFYVLYCRFWELDHDRDYRITREDLLKYGDHSLSHMVVDRIFDAAPRPFAQEKVDREFLSYEDFIYFMLSEEDKANDVSVRYWFSCVDVDGDSKLNNMEMRSFYAVQLHRMQCMGHEIVPFEDMLCQMMDMIKPSNTDCLVVEDFLQPECAQVSGALFDALFNLNKYLMFEQRDPFVERQKREDEFDTDWDRFACIDYNRLAMEEEAREEEAMEIDWVTVDEDEEEAISGGEFAGTAVTTEAPF